jgi:hypothetical protein
MDGDAVMHHAWKPSLFKCLGSALSFLRKKRTLFNLPMCFYKIQVVFAIPYSMYTSLQETQALPIVSGFAEGFLSGLPSVALGTGVLTALNPLPTDGPSVGRDPRQNHLFVESQPSARSAPSEERAPSHLGCRPLCRRLRREAVGIDATCVERPLQGSR